MQLDDLDLQHIEPKRRKIFEPRTRFDYVKIISSIVKRPIPQMLSLTKHFPDQWFMDIASECKQLKSEEAKAKYIWWFIKESKPKETNLTQI